MQQDVEAAPGDGHMLLFWDGGAAPSGWTCISCNPGDDFYQVFPRANDTYGGTGGAASHTHTTTNSIDTTGAGANVDSGGGTTVSDNSHSHSVSATVASASNLPAYRNLQIIRSNSAGEPTTIPSGAIGLFDDPSLPSGWSAYTSQNGQYARSDSAAAGTGGSNTHNHAISITIGTATGATQGPRTNGQQQIAALASHTHTAAATSSTINHEPPYIEVIFGQIGSAASPPDGLVAMWDDDQPLNWTKQSGPSGSFYQRFLKGAATYGSTGGSSSHGHADINTTSSAAIGTGSFRSGGNGSLSTHTHNVNIDNFSNQSHLPPYRDVIVAKRVPQPEVSLSSYRVFNNNDSTDVGAPLASLNAAANTPRQGKPFRLRLTMHISVAQLDPGNKNFKLQYSPRSGTCDTGFSGESYVDVGTTGAIQFHNNSAPSDGDALTTNGNDPSHGGDTTIAQTYEESNNFTSISTVAIGEDALWDFALIDVSASASTSYCFRVVTALGTPLDNYLVVPEIVTDDGEGHMLLLWDGVSVPAGWSCVSCSSGDDFYQRFIRGAGSYGATGGSATHTHTASASVGTTTGTIDNTGGVVVSSGGHTHSATSTVGSGNNLPPFRQLQVIRADTSGVPTSLPAGVIGFFDAVVPAGWTRYATQDGQYVRGENTIGTTGGSATHTHTLSGTLSSATGTDGARDNGGTVPGASDGHTHTYSGPSTSASSEPPYIESILGKKNSAGPVSTGLIAMWDNPVPLTWTDWSGSGQPFNQRFVRPSASYGGTGGATTHTHTNSNVTSSGPSTTVSVRSGAVNAGGAHTHTVTVSSFSNESHLPPYIDVLFAKLAAVNNSPNNPTALDQERPSDSSAITIGGYANSGQVQFTAQVSDTDNPDSLQLCVEVQSTSSSFTGIDTQCGVAAPVSGSPVNANVAVSGLSDGESYHWQARVKDGGGAVSAWVQFGGNLETEADFIIDGTDPAGSVYDGGSTGVDLEYNDGSLDSLSANWDITDAGSGIAGFEISIGTNPSITDVSSWNSIGTATSQTVNSLNLETSQMYYVNIRATDNAGNIVVISSDGQLIAPTLTFSIDTGEINFDNLNAGNSFTDTETTTFTTSTNARNGYEVRAYVTSLLQNATSATIPMFNGGTYASPDEWLPGDTGYGYTSNDATIGGSNKFSPVTCAGGGSGPCFAPFSLAAPGDVVADNDSIVSGTPINNESFTITHRVVAPTAQDYGQYQTVLILNATAIY